MFSLGCSAFGTSRVFYFYVNNKVMIKCRDFFCFNFIVTTCAMFSLGCSAFGTSRIFCFYVNNKVMIKCQNFFLLWNQFITDGATYTCSQAGFCASRSNGIVFAVWRVTGWTRPFCTRSYVIINRRFRNIILQIVKSANRTNASLWSRYTSVVITKASIVTNITRIRRIVTSRTEPPPRISTVGRVFFYI